jgi:hypothetical protein
MTPVVVIEVVLIFGSVLLWAAWQLYQLRQPPRKEDPPASAKPLEGNAAIPAKAGPSDKPPPAG